jgi:hypothetical protein
MNARIKKKIHKITDLCFDVKDLGHDCYLRYFSHVKSFGLDIHKNGWDGEKEVDIHIDLYLDKTDTETKLDEMITCLETLIEES